MSTLKVIPLSQQPRYQAAIGRVVEIGRALAQTEDLINKRRTALIQMQEKVSTPLSYTDRALALARGLSASNPPPESAVKEINRLEAEAVDLKKGMETANAEADHIAAALSREYGDAAKKRHATAVKHILSCVEALCEANRAEGEVLWELERLGYHSHGLTRCACTAVGEINDTNGSPAYYYGVAAKEYLRSL